MNTQTVITKKKKYIEIKFVERENVYLHLTLF